MRAGSQSETRQSSTQVRGEGLSLSAAMASCARCMLRSSSSFVNTRAKPEIVLASYAPDMSETPPLGASSERSTSRMSAQRSESREAGSFPSRQSEENTSRAATASFFDMAESRSATRRFPARPVASSTAFSSMTGALEH